ncbi:MAG: PD-(D/E)XK nuclease family protein, partial [Campylobacteraceae bacterium]
MVEIFATSRSVREFYKSFENSNTLLTKAITISEFESKAFFIPDMVEADTDTRVLLMQEAKNFDSFSKLKIPTEFMAFLQNSNYLFRFFEELANEKVEIKELFEVDIYSEFGEHIQILDEL